VATVASCGLRIAGPLEQRVIRAGHSVRAPRGNPRGAQSIRVCGGNSSRRPIPLPDPAEEPFLAVAAASAGVLVIGNLRQLPLRVRGDVIILSPRVFMERLRPNKP
jgi:hypothetical protein